MILNARRMVIGQAVKERGTKRLFSPAVLCQQIPVESRFGVCTETATNSGTWHTACFSGRASGFSTLADGLRHGINGGDKAFEVFYEKFEQQTGIVFDGFEQREREAMNYPTISFQG